MDFAGSAIEQNVGLLREWESWRPSKSLKYKWIVLAGASDPPKGVHASRRRTKGERGDRAGAFLHGMRHDLNIMEKYILKNKLGDLENVIRAVTK